MAEEKDVEFISSHKYMKNTSTCGTIFTEYLLNAGRDLIIPKLQEKNHHITRRIKEKMDIRMGPAPWEGAVKKFPQTRKTFHQHGDQLGQKKSFRGSEESRAASS